MPLTDITFQVIEACFADTDFRKEIWQYLEPIKSESITDREALSIIRIALNDPDHFESAVELQRIDYRDLFMAAEHGQLGSHMDWASSVLAEPPKSAKERSKKVSVTPNIRGVVKCPKCGFKLNVLKVSSAWNGEKHKRCGQRLMVET